MVPFLFQDFSIFSPLRNRPRASVRFWDQTSNPNSDSSPHPSKPRAYCEDPSGQVLKVSASWDGVKGQSVVGDDGAASFLPIFPGTLECKCILSLGYIEMSCQAPLACTMYIRASTQEVINMTWLHTFIGVQNEQISLILLAYYDRS